jgi:hypothetical protein
MAYLAKRFGGLYSNANKIYLPVHLILALIRWRKFKKNPAMSSYRAIKGLVKSCLFAVLFGMSIPFCGV